MQVSKVLLCLIALAAAVAIAACGGGDDSGGSDGDVSCQPLSNTAYRFEARSLQEVEAGAQPLGESPVAPLPFQFLVRVEADVQGLDRLDALVRHGTEELYDEDHTIIVGDSVWRLISGGNWRESERGQNPVPYTALGTCEAIAPDLALADASPTSEEVNGIASLYYHLEVPNNFFARHENVGPSSELSTRIENVTVDVWVAEDENYPVKVDVKGEATYADGSRLVGEIGYEISDVNATDIDIQPPV